MSEFEQDLTTVHADIEAARRDLLAAVEPLPATDFDRARRGGWTIARVLQHVIDSEWAYSKVVAYLRRSDASGEVESGEPANAADAVRRLNASRAAVLAAADGVDEDTFYQLQGAGHEEFSVLSMLENIALHDREHAAQVQEILEAT